MADVVSSSSSLVPNSDNKYDVFISFRGEETRKNFISHLYDALCRNEIQAYIDEESLKRGERISPALLTAIQQSKLSLVVFSKDYASSRWCLDELVHILKCKKKRGQIVLPVFYHVNPSDIRHQRESYGDAFVAHETRFKHDRNKVEEWRKALKKAANLSGFHLQQHDSEAIFVKNIVEDVLERLYNFPSSNAADDFQGLFGISRRLEKMESLLCINSPVPDVRIIGIWGMGGIGKTTLAEALYKRFSSEFEGCFFTNVKEDVSKHGLKSVKEDLFCKLLKRKSVDMDSYFKDVQLRRKKVLVVLDNVDEIEQLECLVGEIHDVHQQEKGRFGVRSRVIVTSRDKKLLERIADDRIYEVDALDSKEERSLLYLKAFKRDSPGAEYADLIERVLDYANGNPLALKVLGSYLHSRTREEWKSALSELKKAPNEEIQRVLRISYDGLDRVKKSIFLDIACFLKGEDRYFVEGILGGESHIGINVLIERSLITMKDCKLRMHDLIQEMGWEIVNQESSKVVDKRSRLWNAQDIVHVLENNYKDTISIEGIFLDMSKIDEDLCLEPAVFEEMSNLRLLKIHNSDPKNPGKKFKVYLHQGLRYLPNSLRYLSWRSYPSKTLPIKFRQASLVELEMPRSQLTQLWDGVQPFVNLKRIDFSYSEQLAKIPDLSLASRLQSVNLSHCTSLVEIPPLNFQVFDDLKSTDWLTFGFLDLSYCTNLKILPELSGNIKFLRLTWSKIKELPSSIRSLENLLYIDLRGCENQEILPELPRNIERLDLSYTSIREMPTTSIECLRGVRVIHMWGCTRLESLPSNLCELEALTELHLDGCSNLKNFPEILEPMENLKYLCLEETGIQELPSSFANIIWLHKLSMNCCRNLKTIPKCLGTLSCLEELLLCDCNISEIPHWIGSLSSLTRLALNENMFASIPLSIKQLRKLVRLDISYCRNLLSLPELPSSIRELHADGCLSMEMFLTSRPTLTQGFWVNENIRFMFCGCLKLDQSACDIMAMDFLRRVICNAMIVRLADQYASEFRVSHIKVCYPGNRIPKWMTCQSEGSSTLTIKLPSNWDRANFSGFVACIVLSFEELYWNQRRDLDIFFEVHLKTKQGQSHRSGSFSMILEGEFFGHEDGKEFLRSDHVFMWYDYHKNFLKMYNEDFDAVEISFDFGCIERTGISYSTRERECSFKYKVKRCGIHMLYAENVLAMTKVFNNMSIQCKKHMLEAKEIGSNSLEHVQSLQGSGNIEELEQDFQLNVMEAFSEDLQTLYDLFSVEASSYDIGSLTSAPWKSDDRIRSPSRDTKIVLPLSTDLESSLPEADAHENVNNPSSLEIVPRFNDFFGMEVPFHEERNFAGPSRDSTVQTDDVEDDDSYEKSSNGSHGEQTDDIEDEDSYEESSNGSDGDQTDDFKDDVLELSTHEEFSIGSDGDNQIGEVEEDKSDAIIIDKPEPGATQVIKFDTNESRAKCFDFCHCLSFLSQILEWFQANRGN
ncbi:disease resistance-like protein DSC1 [Morus notabilis]|uniref:disease resistance-like protein DSC1 n=1 Tax=Morus notabilis TaxID=981085 RepID=UPI000CED3388|nr:disease resistance-like protein DSC1 [Morus notabilis]